MRACVCVCVCVCIYIYICAFTYAIEKIIAVAYLEKRRRGVAEGNERTREENRKKHHEDSGESSSVTAAVMLQCPARTCCGSGSGK